MIQNDLEVSIVMGVPKNGWFIREKSENNPIKIDDLGIFRGIPLFQEIFIWTIPKRLQE